MKDVNDERILVVIFKLFYVCCVLINFYFIFGWEGGGGCMGGVEV